MGRLQNNNQKFWNHTLQNVINTLKTIQQNTVQFEHVTANKITESDDYQSQLINLITGKEM